mmetsp:Transcript_22596/g.57862  ORF Transcript_22596/g.57862 Transcript_22596/m.57862 type:complete len:372 (-) Transcript_22596:188-1303(-)
MDGHHASGHHAGTVPPANVGAARRALGDIKNLVGNMRSAYGKPPSRRTGDTGGMLPDRSAASSTTAAAPAARFGRSLSLSDASSRPAAVPASAPSSSTQPLPDIDSVDKRNPLAASEYAVDIYKYFHLVEPQFLPARSYMKNQTEITPWMRAVLVDWLVEVHLKFKLMPETLFLTINLIDRFLAAVPVRRKELQLVGVTGMFLASKYEEIWAPEVRDFVYICDKAYSRKQILDMEKKMINTLAFKVSLPTSFHFFHRYIKAAEAEDKRLPLVVSYLVELALVEYDLLQYSYSEVAAAATVLGLRALQLGTSEWPIAAEKHSGYTLEALKPCIAALAEVARKASSPDAEMKAVRKKYSSSDFGAIAKMPLQF